jgi:cytochrome c oxidase cbb3-type subunit 3
VRAARLAAVVVLAVMIVAAGCQREQRRFSEIAPASGRPLSAPGEQRNPYGRNAWAVSEGKQLFTAFNCVGCHANGGGGMGPPLIGPTTVYGDRPVDLFASIVEGRPNGMPAFGGKLTDTQAWQLVGYVQALREQLRRDVRPGRGDTMNVRPSEQSGPRR